ncbi:MAG TPA: SUF system NifU family Fe-S cluster assembly protein [Myxococcota bacterium]|nr:SUF system NifU family Fe-S cluster assembly protein [Myxococcota bacterium]
MSELSLDALYREVVLEHYRNPRHRAPLAHPSAEARVTNPVCGDQVWVEVELADGRIADVSSRARGCSIAVASGSVMTELVSGLSPERARALGHALEAVVKGEPPAADLDPRLRAFARVATLPSRQRCATLAWEALAEALG